MTRPNQPDRKTVAVLGAGIQGVFAALCLAERGHYIILIDREPQAVSKASLWNEGKIHLGYLFANDAANSTARAMIDGAQAFFPILSRFVDAKDIVKHRSTPFIYAVPKDSLLSVDAIESHFANVSDLLGQRRFDNGQYFEEDDVASFHRLPRAEFDKQFDDHEVQAAFQTKEISIDTFRVASALRAAVDQHPRIETRFSTDVVQAETCTSGCELVHLLAPCGNPDLVKADLVVNALWSDRLRVDSTKGIHPSEEFSFRFKLALHIKKTVSIQELNSTTLMLGGYGDVVVFPDSHMYLSWYPSCLQNSSCEIQPPRWENFLNDNVRSKVRRDVLDELSRRIPAVDKLQFAESDVSTEGGIIFSWGSGEINDLSDSVHKRVDIGLFNKGNYFSIDTGKYGMAPFFGAQLTRVVDG